MASGTGGFCIAAGVMGLAATFIAAGGDWAAPRPEAAAPAVAESSEQRDDDPDAASPGPPFALPVEARLAACQSALDTFSREGGEQFRRDFWELTPRGRAVIEGLAAAVEPYGGFRIAIHGHTDAQGRRRNNLELSQKRAETVRDHLIRLGLSPDRLSAVGFGPEQPIASNRTEEGRARNRRIAFRVSQ